MNESMEKFLDEGFQRFAEAYEAVSLFGDTVGEQLRDMLEQREWVWSGFAPDLDRIKMDWDGGKNQGCWIYATVPGKLEGHTLTLDCGFWWAPPKLHARLIAYGSFYNVPAALQQFDYKPRNTRIQSRKIGDSNRLYIIDPSSDPNIDVSTIIDELILLSRQPLSTGK